jgi:hypothetical protein
LPRTIAALAAFAVPRSQRLACAWRIQFRNASGWTFNCSASRGITGVGSDSRYNRTVRSGNSTGYFLFAATKTSFLGLQDQTWFGSLRKNRGLTGDRFGVGDDQPVGRVIQRLHGWPEKRP